MAVQLLCGCYTPDCPEHHGHGCDNATLALVRVYRVPGDEGLCVCPDCATAALAQGCSLTPLATVPAGFWTRALRASGYEVNNG